MFDVIIVNADIELAYTQLQQALFGVSVCVLATHFSHFIKWQCYIVIVYFRKKNNNSLRQRIILTTLKIIWFQFLYSRKIRF